MVLKDIQKIFFYLLAPILFVAALFFYQVTNTVSQYFENETVLAAQSIDDAQSQIQQYLLTLRTDVGRFVEVNQQVIKQLVDKPDNQELYRKVEKLILADFPDAVTFTVVDHDGYLLIEDKKSLIGKGCRENIRLFVVNSQQSNAQLRIHSDDRNYHFDIMQEMHTSDGKVFIFYISFEANEIAKYIATSQRPDHEVFIIKKDSDSLIEITELGARIKLNRDKFLTVEEQKNIIVRQDIDNTLWQLVDILNKNKVDEILTVFVNDYGELFAAAIFGFVLFYFYITRRERVR